MLAGLFSDKIHQSEFLEIGSFSDLEIKHVLEYFNDVKFANLTAFGLALPVPSSSSISAAFKRLKKSELLDYRSSNISVLFIDN